MLWVFCGEEICYNQVMKTQIQHIFTKYHVFITMALVCIVAAIIGFGEYRRIELNNRLTGNLASTTVALEAEIKGLGDKITSIVEQNNLLNEAIQTEIQKSEDLADQVDQVNDTAVALDKLSKVDTQLLQKYSKVFFLNEHYVPSGLSAIPSQFGFDKNKEYEIHSKIDSYLEKMLESAQADGVDIKVISAYRSFGTQAILKSGYQVIYGAGTANQFSADQGYSEHQLGTTVDFTTPETKENFDLFDGTPAYKWLKANAYEYGFVISYPKSNAYYTYEPWHWRFVGVDLANRLHRNSDYFYDMDQRKINNYLGVFFD
jgi:LAS superfamily LD-carboxypeptidase LdcB